MPINKCEIGELLLANNLFFKTFNFKRFVQGYNNEVYLITLDSKKIVLKIYNSKEIFEKERSILIFLKSKNIEVPDVLHSGSINTKTQQNYLFMSYITGDSAMNFLSKIPDKKAFFEKVGEFRGKLHSIYSTEFGKIISMDKDLQNPFSNWTNYFEARLKKLKKKTPSSQRDLFFEEYKDLLKLDHGPCFCQGDSSLNNLIVNDSYEIKGILDFEFALWGGGLYDVCTSVKSFPLVEPYLNSLIKGYSLYHNVPPDWKKLLYFYQWFRSHELLISIDEMSWECLSSEDSEVRKKNIRVDVLEKISSYKFVITELE
jgi:Ser/Thr protein kinase RdoA (MazF antagonist)